MRGKMTTRYEIDGLPVAVRVVNAGFPRHYSVQIDDGPVLGYLRRSALSHAVDAYLGSAEPDTRDAHWLGSYPSMRGAVHRIVREAISRAIAPQDPEVPA